MVEHFLAKEDVEGSNPFSRSKHLRKEHGMIRVIGESIQLIIPDCSHGVPAYREAFNGVQMVVGLGLLISEKVRG